MSVNERIDSSSVVLVSGGGRGVTAQCVIKLAERHQCKFILLGRSSIAEPEPEWARDCNDESELKKRIMQSLITQGNKPTPAQVKKIFQAIAAQREITKTLSDIEQVGGQAEYLSVDITNPSTLQVKLEAPVKRWGNVTGIVHGAGNLADKLIENKTEQDFETVYAAKIEGLQTLLGCVDQKLLAFIVLFSSFVAFYGNSGQSDYALANEILNKLAYLFQRHHPSCRVVSIGWGPWDGGMVTPQLKKFFTQQDMELIPVAVGAQLLVDELHPSHHGTTQVLVMNKPVPSMPRSLGTKLQSFRIYRKLTLAANPFICDHVIASNPVLPAMCGITWIGNTCEQLYPGYTFFSCNDYKVLKGIVFDESLAREYVLDLREINKSEAGEIEFEAIVWSESSKKIPHYHYSTQLKLMRIIPQVSPCDLFTTCDLVTNNEEKDLIRLHPYKTGALFHRRGFQGIQRILKLSPKNLNAECILVNIEAKKQGQFPIQTYNCYTADTLFQCLLVWARHFYDLGSLPLQIGKLEQFKMIPFNQQFFVSLEIHLSSKTKVVASATAHDAQGQVYLRADQMQVTASSRLNSLFLDNICSKTECMVLAN